eukprot:TRINITY_DN17536_c0_g2_i1.p1 TRINITY_DN17536_c0_g2~~TRINITY_DN17536_c0_g2_i1.p1  ORF type:complete len:197 (+),score=36.87 TRINITY_DN17536_c0_g2_i1:114-704(+)
MPSLVGSEMCIRDRRRVHGQIKVIGTNQLRQDSATKNTPFQEYQNSKLSKTQNQSKADHVEQQLDTCGSTDKKTYSKLLKSSSEKHFQRQLADVKSVIFNQQEKYLSEQNQEQNNLSYSKHEILKQFLGKQSLARKNFSGYNFSNNNLLRTKSHFSQSYENYFLSNPHNQIMKINKMKSQYKLDQLMKIRCMTTYN